TKRQDDPVKTIQLDELTKRMEWSEFLKVLLSSVELSIEALSFHSNYCPDTLTEDHRFFILSSVYDAFARLKEYMRSGQTKIAWEEVEELKASLIRVLVDKGLKGLVIDWFEELPHNRRNEEP
ncbi:MAG: hypothetical protein JNK26_05270, partial [Candidatus Doudnabacteria bacterium]|nr:hypothetical protein [Candidatus Doudnabacteria bacterium]